MAGRNSKTNFDFFRVYTGFFSNKKIKALRRKYGSVGILTYLYILDYAYGNDGYYIKINDIEDFAYDVAESIADSNLRQVASVATECINYLVSRGEINADLVARGVITGESIQRQYIELCKSTKRKVDIKEEYRLVDTLEYPIEKNPISSEEIPINSEEIPINSEEMQQSKVNRNNNISLNACARENSPFKPEEYQDFIKQYQIIDMPTVGGKLCDMDFKKISDAYARSKYLRTEKQPRYLKFIVTHYNEIVTGYYDDTAPKGANNDTNDVIILGELRL